MRNQTVSATFGPTLRKTYVTLDTKNLREVSAELCLISLAISGNMLEVKSFCCFITIMDKLLWIWHKSLYRYRGFQCMRYKRLNYKNEGRNGLMAVHY